MKMASKMFLEKVGEKQFMVIEWFPRPKPDFWNRHLGFAALDEAEREVYVPVIVCGWSDTEALIHLAEAGEPFVTIQNVMMIKSGFAKQKAPPACSTKAFWDDYYGLIAGICEAHAKDERGAI
jgi:hypothetical protein